MKSNGSTWYKYSIFYEVYVRAFLDSNGDGHGDLQGLTEKLDYLQELGVDCIWLLPTYPSPLKDDGYDISDYLGVLPEYGTIEDFKELIKSVHKRGMRVITDLVVNHTSDQHPWFQAARSDRNSPYRDYYVWSDTDQKYSEARIIFLDTETSNWTWDDTAGQYYWHRFYSSQPDLNFDNPRVREEILQAAGYWLDLGIDGFRVDAVPYLFEREGTNCENLPETHQFLKQFRAYVNQNYPGRILLCEANQWPEDVRPYFGKNDEFHMGFHFPLMPRIYMALRKGNVRPLKWILDRTPPIPDECQWCTFLRNHDELTLEMVTEEERQWMWEEYAPEPRMRLNLGIRRRLAPLLDNDRRKIEIAYSLLFTLPGSPIVYYGDEIGMGDNIWLPDRNGVRTPMQWDNLSPNAGFSTAEPDALYSPINDDKFYKPEHVSVIDQMTTHDTLWHTLKSMIAARKSEPVFGAGNFNWVETGNNAIAAYIRSLDDERIFVINNLSDSQQSFVITADELGLHRNIHVILSKGKDLNLVNTNLSSSLEPYEYIWFKIS